MPRNRIVLDAVHDEISRNPGRTELELTRAIYGEHPFYSRVNVQCRRLILEGRIYRQGNGGRKDPFRYFPVAS